MLKPNHRMREWLLETPHIPEFWWLEVYSGAQPHDPNSLPTGVLLAEGICPNDAKVQTIMPVLCTGTAGWVRYRPIDGMRPVLWMDGSIGDDASTCEMKMWGVELFAGSSLQLNFSVTLR